MKNLKLGGTFVVMIIAIACQKNATIDSDIMKAEINGIAALISTVSAMPCGTPKTVIIYAGQHTEAGNVTVSNDGTNLYVKFTTKDGWFMKAAHLWIGNCNELPSPPAPGQFPYKKNFETLSTDYTFTIALADLANYGTCFCLMTHTELKKVVNGGVVQEETGWGGDGEHPHANWAKYFTYCIQPCIPPPVDDCFQDETAWVAGTRYAKKGNWATFTNYVAGSTVNIYAGQTILVGTCHFSPVDGSGNVTVTINLTGTWGLNGSESVKIQGYNTAPSGNPSPGLFTTYKGTSMVVTVPAYSYYGIHLDVHKKIPCAVVIPQ